MNKVNYSKALKDEEIINKYQADKRQKGIVKHAVYSKEEREKM